MADIVEICNVYARKAIIKAAKRIINSDKMCRSYSDLNFDVTFLEHSVCHSKFIQKRCSCELSSLVAGPGANRVPPVPADTPLSQRHGTVIISARTLLERPISKILQFLTIT